MEVRVEWSADWNGQTFENKLKRDIVPCCPHVQPAAALPPHHSTSLQGWSAGGGARQSWWTHCHPALRHSGKDLKETITLSKCLRPSMKSSLVSVDRREQIALNKQIGFGLDYMNKYNLWNVPLPAWWGGRPRRWPCHRLCVPQQASSLRFPSGSEDLVWLKT